MDNRTKFKAIVEKIKQWHKQVGITVNGNVTTQYTKLIEELDELLEASSKKHVDDALGDIIVVTIAIAELLKINIEYDSITYNTTTNKGDKEKILKIILKLAPSIIRNNTSSIQKLITELFSTIQQYFGDLYYFAETAYNVIKHRSGFLLSNGNFVKGEELSIVDISTNLFYTVIKANLSNKPIIIEVDAIHTLLIDFKIKTWQDFIDVCNKNNIDVNILAVKEC